MCCKVQVWYVCEFNQGVWLCPRLRVRWQQWWTELWRLYIWTRLELSFWFHSLVFLTYLPVDKDIIFCVEEHMVLMYCRQRRYSSVCIIFFLGSLPVNFRKLEKRMFFKLTCTTCYLLLSIKGYVAGMIPAKVLMIGIEIVEEHHPGTQGQMWITH